jgi:hypothetical protein
VSRLINWFWHKTGTFFQSDYLMPTGLNSSLGDVNWAFVRFRETSCTCLPPPRVNFHRLSENLITVVFVCPQKLKKLLCRRRECALPGIAEEIAAHQI